MNQQQAKEPYTTPKLVAHECLRDITTAPMMDYNSSGMTQVDPPS